MAILSNINGKFAVDSTGVIQELEARVKELENK